MTQPGEGTAIPAGSDQPTRKQTQELIARYGLKRAGARAPLTEYARELWNRRHFIVEFSRATNASGYSASMLGQAWQVLTPLLNAAVYYVIFGLLLGVSRGVNNYIGFLVTGVFVFHFIQNTVTSSARSLHSNLPLARTLRFPRAVFPVSATVVALQKLLMALVVLVPIILATGEPLRLQWLEVIPVLALQSLFCAGLAFIFARLGAKLPDVSQMLPFALRIWFYASGVMFSIDSFTADKNPMIGHVMNANPATIFLDLYRGALMASEPGTTAGQWLAALVWSAAVLAAGFIFFWKAEEEYGRD